MSKKTPYEVGYGKPPIHTRFSADNPGNRKGRPKGSPNLTTVIARAAREKVIVTVNGRRKTITKLEAAMTQLANQAAAGDRHAIQLLILQIERIERTAAQTPGTAPTDRKENDAEILKALKKRLTGAGKDQGHAGEN
jgi:hypothetical protein